MDEMTNTQNVDMPEDVDVAAFDDEDEEFDMDAATAAAVEMYEQQDVVAFNEMDNEGFASMFATDWAITPPTDPKKVSEIIRKQFAKKAASRRS